MQITTRPVELISQALLEKMDKAFRSPYVQPGVDRDVLMFEAGQRSVVDWLHNYLKETSMQSMELEPSAEAKLRAQVRYGS